MISIEDEIKAVIVFLSLEAGFDVDMGGCLCIRPIYEMREFWEVSWSEPEEAISCEYHREFVSLEEAATFFVEKRHYLCLGLDFNEIARDYYNETGHYKDEPGHPNDPANCHVKVGKVDE